MIHLPLSLYSQSLAWKNKAFIRQICGMTVIGSQSDLLSTAHTSISVVNIDERAGVRSYIVRENCYPKNLGERKMLLNCYVPLHDI